MKLVFDESSETAIETASNTAETQYILDLTICSRVRCKTSLHSLIQTTTSSS
jgi:hypothetical protein